MKIVLNKQRSLFYSLIFVPVIFFAGCRVALVPAYDAALQTQIENTAKATDMMYLQLMSSPDSLKNFRNYLNDYLNIETNINSILLKNEVRLNAADIVASIKILKDYFIKAKEDHAKRGVISNAEALIYNEQLKALWKPVLIEEIALSKAR